VSTLVVLESSNRTVCRFTSCYDQDSTQEEIFMNDVQPMIDVVYSGVVSNEKRHGILTN
jgi:kinesin family member 22